LKGARAAQKKYYLKEEARYERLTEGGDFFCSGRSAPLRLSIPHARNFVLCLSIYLLDGGDCVDFKAVHPGLDRAMIGVKNTRNKKTLDTIWISDANLDVIFFTEAGVFIKHLTLPKYASY